jgi:hypothetical protein
MKHNLDFNGTISFKRGEGCNSKRLKVIEALHSQIQAQRTAGIKGTKANRHNTLEIGSDESTHNYRQDPVKDIGVHMYY